MRVYLFWILTVTWSFQVHAQFDSGTTIFIMDSVSELETVINNISDEDKEDAQNEADAISEAGGVSTDGDTHTITIPVRQDDGTYESVEIDYTETDDTRTITIPDRGDITLVEDENGNYSFELTPEQIAGSSNVSCTVGSNKKGSCTIEPFITMVGDKVLSADKLVLDYTEGQNLIVAGGTAHNLKLTDENSETGFFNSQTDAGDAGVNLTFSKNGEVKEGPLDFIPTPARFEDQKYMRMDVDTSRLVHTVRNPNDSSQTAEKFAVKDGGVSTSIIISREDHLNMDITGTTHGGIRYNSDPFSERSVTVDTNAPLMANLSVDNNPENPKTSLSMGMVGEDAEATIVDNRDPKKTDTIKASGNTFINLSQATLYDEENGKIIDKSKPVAFEMGSDSIQVVNQNQNGKTSTATFNGIQAAGTVNPENDNKDITIAANSVNLKDEKNGNLQQEIGLSGDVRAIMQEDDKAIKYQGMTQHAYYNNGESSINLSDGAYISVTEYKEGAGETFNGKEVKNDAFAMAQTGSVTNGDTTVNIEGGVEFRQIQFEDDSSIVAINGDTGKVGNEEYGVNLNDGFSVVNETDSNGDTRFTRITSTETSATDKDSGDKIGILNSTTTSQIIPVKGGKDTLIVNHTSDGIKYESGDGKDQAEIEGITINAVDADTVKYGDASFNKAILKTKDGDVNILGASAVVYSDDDITSGTLDITKIEAKQKDYAIDVEAIGADGTPGKFKIMFFENADGRYVKIFGEDGKRVHLDSLDKDSNYASVLAETVEYLETDKFKSFLATNLSGSYQNIEANDGKLTSFDIGRVAGVESIDGNFRQFEVNDGRITNFDGGQETGLGFESVLVTDVTENGTRIITGAVQNGAIDYVEYKPGTGKPGTTANISFGSAIGASMEGPDGSDITMFKANDIEILAVDYDSAIKASGQVGEVNYYDDAKITSIEAKDLKDFNIEDTSSGVMATLNSDRIVRVVERDDAGNETGSYLLMKKGTLDVTDAENGIKADIRVGILEFAQDKVNDQNIILEADIEGRVTVDKTKSPVAAEANFALKGKNLTTASHSYISDDGKTVEKSFSIIALGDEGRLDKLELEAGPDFLKDAISLQAKGSEAGGKELTFSFRQDKGEGTYYVRAEFKDGDKVKVKLFPFTLESKKEGNDAVAELLLTPKGQNYMNHMHIISNVVSAEEITDWLEISDGGMIIARTGDIGGFGFEMMWQDKQYFNPNPMDDFSGASRGQRAATYALGVYKENDEGDRTTVGLMLSGDSELEYQTNGRGVLKIFNVDMPQNGAIPTTVNLYMRKKWKDGDSLYAGLSADMASYMVDRDAINNDARFFEGGRRDFGGLGANVAYSKDLGSGSHITFSAGANQDFSNPAVCISFTKTFGETKPTGRRLNRTISDSMRAINRMPSSTPNFGTSPTLSGAIAKLQHEVGIIGRDYDEIKAFERIRDSLDKTLKALDEGTLTEENYRDTYSVSQKDINLIKAYESRHSRFGMIGEQLENLNFVLNREMTRKKQIARLHEREANIRDAMERLTKRFEDEDSSVEIMEEYSKKVAELDRLRQ